MEIPNEVLHLAEITQDDILRVVKGNKTTIFTPTEEISYWFNGEEFVIVKRAVETFGWA